MIKTYRERRDEIESQKELWRDVWNRQTLSEDYFAGVRWDQYPEVFARHLPQGAVVLEAGCGLGKYVMYLDRQGHKVIGVDLDEQALVRAHQYDTHLSLAVADVARLPFPDNSFDAYVSLGVIEHFEVVYMKAFKGVDFTFRKTKSNWFFRDSFKIMNMTI